jgi:tetratricopeptide (TPR) repeat protein
MYKFVLIGLLMLVLYGSQAQSFFNTDSLEHALSQKNGPLEKMEILSELANIFLAYDPDQALAYAQQLHEIAEINNDYDYKLKSYLLLSEIYSSKTDLRQSMELANKSLNLAENLDKEKEYAEALILISKNYTELGNYEKSAD